jgi:parallel beta-helix repeat protein
MRISESNPTLINCSFIQNVANTRGGGIYNSRTASPTLINCTFAGNLAANYGGGMYNRDSTRPTLVNCTFTGNSADDAGGAVYNYGYDGSVRITLNNCTFSGNSAANGNDLACDSPYGPPSNVEITNCILWDGENPIWNNDGSTITITYSDVHGGWPGQGNIDADPCFVDTDGDDDIPGTEDDNLRLFPDSPCIDAGDPNYVTEPNETDLDGKPRVIGGRIDMGAYEFLSQMILYVDTDATGANDGSSWAGAFNFLQDALAVAYSGDEIRVAQGSYKPDQGDGITLGDQTATFQLINSVTLKGGYAGFGEPDPDVRDIALYETILSGDLNGDDIQVDDPLDLDYRYDNSHHVVIGSGTDETTVLDGFTVTAGQGIGIIPGGGMYNDKGSPTIINCTFSWNGAAGSSDCAGGGMFNNQSSPMLIGCTFSHNAASWPGGGGISNLLSSPTLINCVFVGNKSGGPDGGQAGAMDNWENSSPTLINCVFIGNYAEGVAGAIYSGGNYVDTVSSPTLINCTFVGNSAGYRGGAIIQESGMLRLTNCIMWDNTAPEGNVMYLQHGYQVDATVNISYSDIEGGQSGFYIEQGCTLNWGVGNIDADPCFVDLGYWDANGVWVDGDYHLLVDSPCIDAGDPDYPYEPNETDIDGNPRIIGRRIDMGAYEYRFIISAEARVLPQTINLASKGNWITCYIRLPIEFNVADIEPNSILLEDEIQPVQFSVDEQQQVATARFTREEVQTILEEGDIELTITGRLTDGTVFEGTDTIKVIDKAGKN